MLPYLLESARRADYNVWGVVLEQRLLRVQRQSSKEVADLDSWQIHTEPLKLVANLQARKDVSMPRANMSQILTGHRGVASLAKHHEKLRRLRPRISLESK